MHKKYLGKYLFLWQTKSLTYLRHCCSTHVQASRTDTTSRCSHFCRDPACLTWRAIALRCTVNSFHSWYKLPSTLTTYHTAYLFSFSLPWYVAYSQARILAKFNYVERGLRFIQAHGYGEFPCAVLWCNLMELCELRRSLAGRIIGASLNEPHTSVTALRTRVCIYACLLGPTTYRKF